MTPPIPAWDDEQGEKLWAAVFHPEVIAGVVAAQEQHDAAVLAALERDIEPVSCEISNCTYEAVVAGICAHSNAVVYLTCGAHREALIKHARRWRCRACNHAGTTPQLLKWRPMFTRRSRA